LQAFGLIQINQQNAEAAALANHDEIPMQRWTFGRMATPRAAEYFATEHLRDGREIEIRALHQDDRDEMLAAVGRTGAQSMRRRFFVTKRGFSEAEIAFFMNIDFVNHVALVAEIDEDGRPAIIGGGRYIVVQPGQAEVAFVVVDAYQGQGIGKILVRHLLDLARQAGLRELIAEVLPENVAMRRVLSQFGFQISSRDDPRVIRLSAPLA
jgi:RimJ/RimL family protein N-acetyltransferase